MSDDDAPDPAVAVSPDDHSSDRQQADADQAVNVASNLDDRHVADAADAAAVASQLKASSERADARDQAELNQGITSDRIDALIAASERQASTNEELAIATVEYQERARLARRRFRVTIVALTVMTGAILTGIFVVLAQVYATVDSGKQVRSTLLDCVQPTGKCYQDGQKQTAKVVGALNQVTALAAACAPDYVALPLTRRIAAIEHCIEKGLTK